MISIEQIINGVDMFLNMQIKLYMTFTIDDTFLFFFLLKTYTKLYIKEFKVK